MLKQDPFLSVAGLLSTEPLCVINFHGSNCIIFHGLYYLPLNSDCNELTSPLLHSESTDSCSHPVFFSFQVFILTFQVLSVSCYSISTYIVRIWCKSLSLRNNASLLWLHLQLVCRTDLPNVEISMFWLTGLTDYLFLKVFVF